jgi:branched-chain amino acid aminotransferase
MMYYNEDTIIYFKGKFIKAAEAKANPYDATLHYGYGVFEGIRSYTYGNGVKIFKAKEHFDRMKSSCEAMMIPYPYNNDELIGISYEILKRNHLTDGYIRPLVTVVPNMHLGKAAASELFIAAWGWGTYLGDNLLHVETSAFRRPNPAAFIMSAKVTGHYVNSILASQKAKDNGFDEALLLDTEGYVAEGPGANIFIENNGRLFTPELGSILPGITRATVLEISEKLGIDVVEKKIKPEEVHGADSAFFCGTAAEVIGLSSLDRIPFKKEWKDSLGSRIQKEYRELTTGEKKVISATEAINN